MSRLVTYETEPAADLGIATPSGPDEEVPVLVLGGPARRALGHLAGRAPAGVAVLAVEASSELVRLTRVIVSVLTVRGNGSIRAMIDALDQEEAKPEKGFSSPLQEAVFLLLLRPRVLRLRSSKRHLGPMMQDLAKRLESILGLKLRPPRVVVMSPVDNSPEANTPLEFQTEETHIGPREIYREVLARVRAALATRAN